MTEKSQSDQGLCAVLLLAGSSKRFGSDNKLLSIINSTPICAHALGNLLNSSIETIFIVTGHDQKRVTLSIQHLLHRNTDRIRLVHNEAYGTGMGSSIAAGLRQAANFDAALICLGDMPYVSNEVIEALKNAWINDNRHLAFVPEHNKRIGNPVILSKSFFPKLVSLKADIGAKELLLENQHAVLNVPVASDAIFRDIDTISDLTSP